MRNTQMRRQGRNKGRKSKENRRKTERMRRREITRLARE